MASYAPVPSNPAALCDGDKLIVPQGAALPANVCIKCGAPANAKPLKKTYYWHSPWLYLLILVGLLVYAIVAIIVRKQQLLYLPLCDEHAARRKRMILLGWGLFTGAIAAVIVLPAAGVDAGIALLLMLGLFIAAIIVGSIGAKLIKPTFIDASYASYSGACRPFLDQLPRGVNAAAIPFGTIPPTANFPPPGGTPPPPRAM
jgi:hypothetical protein